ncbi:hypothetical protein GOP47_0027126 [Adiantum capillus-veneris]|nr:hypothetical protein GOP47_0027126 [Adiantum capillus-veneris]
MGPSTLGNIAFPASAPAPTEPYPVTEGRWLSLAAVEVGYRHFDTAKIYNNEGLFGEALKEAMEAGLVKREDFFVTSKLWCSDAYPDGVLPALRNSLRCAIWYGFIGT